jgi:hypothetical protein
VAGHYRQRCLTCRWVTDQQLAELPAADPLGENDFLRGARIVTATASLAEFGQSNAVEQRCSPWA